MKVSELTRTRWESVELGDTVYLDNTGGTPTEVLGPFTVVKGNGCGRCLMNVKGRTFMHYPEDLLVTT